MSFRVLLGMRLKGDQMSSSNSKPCRYCKQNESSHPLERPFRHSYAEPGFIKWEGPWVLVTSVLALISGFLLGAGIMHLQEVPTVSGASTGFLVCGSIVFLVVGFMVFASYMEDRDKVRTPEGVRDASHVPTT